MSQWGGCNRNPVHLYIITFYSAALSRLCFLLYHRSYSKCPYLLTPAEQKVSESDVWAAPARILLMHCYRAALLSHSAASPILYMTISVWDAELRHKKRQHICIRSEIWCKWSWCVYITSDNIELHWQHMFTLFLCCCSKVKPQERNGAYTTRLLLSLGMCVESLGCGRVRKCTCGDASYFDPALTGTRTWGQAMMRTSCFILTACGHVVTVLPLTWRTTGSPVTQQSNQSSLIAGTTFTLYMPLRLEKANCNPVAWVHSVLASCVKLP